MTSKREVLRVLLRGKKRLLKMERPLQGAYYFFDAEFVDNYCATGALCDIGGVVNTLPNCNDARGIVSTPQTLACALLYLSLPMEFRLSAESWHVVQIAVQRYNDAPDRTILELAALYERAIRLMESSVTLRELIQGPITKEILAVCTD